MAKRRVARWVCSPTTCPECGTNYTDGSLAADADRCEKCERRRKAQAERQALFGDPPNTKPDRECR